MGTFSFINAWPVKWSISDLKATENAILIETLELSYDYFTKIDPWDSVMPVEICELVIKAYIGDPDESRQSTRATSSPVNRDELVDECVEQVLQILKEKARR